MLIALLALPVLLVLGLLAGNALTDNDTVEVAGGTPVGATPSISAPALQGPTVATTPAPTTEAPAATPAETTPAATTAPPTTAPASTPAEATSSPATTSPTASPSTTAPRASPTPTPSPTATSPPADEEAQADEPGSNDADDGTVTRAAPTPEAGRDVVYAEGSVGDDVRTWQARMVERGWVMRADGIFGPRTESVVRSFQAEKGLTVDGLLGQRTWNAAWTSPVT